MTGARRDFIDRGATYPALCNQMLRRPASGSSVTARKMINEITTAHMPAVKMTAIPRRNFTDVNNTYPRESKWLSGASLS